MEEEAVLNCGVKYLQLDNHMPGCPYHVAISPVDQLQENVEFLTVSGVLGGAGGMGGILNVRHLDVRMLDVAVKLDITSIVRMQIFWLKAKGYFGKGGTVGWEANEILDEVRGRDWVEEVGQGEGKEKRLYFDAVRVHGCSIVVSVNTPRALREEEKVLEEVEQGRPTPNEMRSFAEADINALVIVAIAGIDAAEHTTSQDCQPFLFAEIFQMAREALLDGRVVETIMMLGSIMTVAGLSKLRQKSLDESVNKVRDVLVMRICTIQEDPESYIEFKALSENAFNMQLDKTTHSQLAHAYRKLAISTHARLEKWGFVSNAHLEAKRRGGTRPRPKKRDTGRASASASCTAALPLELPDPAYVMLQPANTTGYNGQAHTTTALDQRQKNGFQLPASRQPLDMVGFPPPEKGYPQDAVQGCHTLLNTTSHWAATATNPAAQAVWGLSGPTMNSTTDSQGSMHYHMHHRHFANSYTYSVDMSTAYNNPLQMA